MLIESGLFLLLAAVQITARYNAKLPNNIYNEINPESAAVLSSSSRIASGWEAKPGQFPYHVALRTVNEHGSSWRCGGAIIAHEWVVTTAQCTKIVGGCTRGLNIASDVRACQFKSLEVPMCYNVNYLSTPKKWVAITVRVGLIFHNPNTSYPAEKWYRHPKYNELSVQNQPNDIALLKTLRPIVYSNLVQPIRIQSSADAYRDYDGEQVYITGHGRDGPFGVGVIPDMLRWVHLRAISNSECARVLPTSPVVDTTICARYFNVTTQSPCHGDGGAPLVHVGSDGVPTLIGIWSFMWSDPACKSGLPTGYTRPGPYLPWFKEVTGIDFEKQEDDTTTTTSTPASTTTAIPITTSTLTTPTITPSTTSTTTESEDVTTPLEGSGEEDDSDSSESDKDDDIAQLLKRLQVIVKVKVRMDKFSTTKAVGMEVEHDKY